MMNVEFIILTFHHFLFFSQNANFKKLNDSEVFDLFDPFDRIDSKRNNALLHKGK
jgi:hypothetical protein